MKLYGPSDIEFIKLADGHTHSFVKASQRELVPGFGDDERSLPFVDCAACAEFLQLQGWSKSTNKVTQTADEQEYVRDSKEQGSMYMRGIMEGMGRGVARETEEATGVRTRRSKARRG